MDLGIMETIQIAVEKISNSMRIYGENSSNSYRLFQLGEKEEATNNLDRAFESKLEAFHSLYDVTKNKFNYFLYADTSLLILLRNAIHHKDHLLFKSWNAEMHLNSGMKKMAGATFLMVNYKLEGQASQYYYKLEDIFDRIDIEKKMSEKNRKILLKLLNEELFFSKIKDDSQLKRFPLSQVYINVIPIFISAMSKVFKEFKHLGIKLNGFDSDVYSKHFASMEPIDFSKLTYKELKIPYYID